MSKSAIYAVAVLTIFTRNKALKAKELSIPYLGVRNTCALVLIY
jgi:hypothetical protein